MGTDIEIEIETSARTDLNVLFKKTPCMPIVVRLAWHDAGTYNADDKTGGANGTVRFSPESEHKANTGLGLARDLLQPIKDKLPEMSYADFYQLANVAAVEYAGGPKIPFRFGRVDALNDLCTPDGRLPNPTKRMPHLRDVFHRMGLSDKDITVLSGAHTLGGAHADRSGLVGPWTAEPTKFDNSYFVEILKENPNPKLLRLATDLALLDEPETKDLCVKYAEDQDAFFADYIESAVKLSELGCFQ